MHLLQVVRGLHRTVELVVSWWWAEGISAATDKVDMVVSGSLHGLPIVGAWPLMDVSARACLCGALDQLVFMWSHGSWRGYSCQGYSCQAYMQAYMQRWPYQLA
jgi:hypothetical protein